MYQPSFALALSGLFSTVLLFATPSQACSPEDLSSVPLGYNIDLGTDVQQIFFAHCGGCHLGGASGGLSLEPDVAHDNLVNVPSSNASAGMPRVTPFDPANSFLFRKINCESLDPSLGLRMPRSGPPYLSKEQQAVIMDWILEGAFPLADPGRIFGSGMESRANVPDL